MKAEKGKSNTTTDSFQNTATASDKESQKGGRSRPVGEDMGTHAAGSHAHGALQPRQPAQLTVQMELRADRNQAREGRAEGRVDWQSHP